MKLVIEIDEDLYKRIKKNDKTIATSYPFRPKMIEAIRNGRPLDDYLFPFDYKKGDNDENN